MDNLKENINKYQIPVISDIILNYYNKNKIYDGIYLLAPGRGVVSALQKTKPSEVYYRSIKHKFYNACQVGNYLGFINMINLITNKNDYRFDFSYTLNILLEKGYYSMAVIILKRFSSKFNTYPASMDWDLMVSLAYKHKVMKRVFAQEVHNVGIRHWFDNFLQYAIEIKNESLIKFLLKNANYVTGGLLLIFARAGNRTALEILFSIDKQQLVYLCTKTRKCDINRRNCKCKEKWKEALEACNDRDSIRYLLTKLPKPEKCNHYPKMYEEHSKQANTVLAKKIEPGMSFASLLK